jgi:hypothetical protein
MKLDQMHGTEAPMHFTPERRGYESLPVPSPAEVSGSGSRTKSLSTNARELSPSLTYVGSPTPLAPPSSPPRSSSSGMWRGTTRRWPRPLRSTWSRWLSSDAAPEPPRRVAALWGNGDYGRLGLGALESQWSPTACPFFLARAGDPPVSLACGGAHTLFLTRTRNTSSSVYAGPMVWFKKLTASALLHIPTLVAV